MSNTVAVFSHETSYKGVWIGSDFHQIPPLGFIAFSKGVAEQIIAEAKKSGVNFSFSAPARLNIGTTIIQSAEPLVTGPIYAVPETSVPLSWLSKASLIPLRRETIVKICELCGLPANEIDNKAVLIDRILCFSSPADVTAGTKETETHV